MNWRVVSLLPFLFLGVSPLLHGCVAEKIDSFIDSRFEAKEGAAKLLFKELEAGGIDNMAKLESAVRSSRAQYPEKAPPKMQAITCDHVDYSTRFFIYQTKGLDLKNPLPLVIVGHGGNSSMPQAYADRTAQGYLHAYQRLGDELGAIVVAPSSCRGWGHIGNSLMLTTISKIQRLYRIDPDRIYLTGQSMGGHLTYRAALSLPDHWGAVSPHSGGYDFVEKKSIANLFNVPGYAVWGKREPYGINTDNRSNHKWAKANGLEWKFIEKNGGHEIYNDELPKIAEFFKAHKRNLYRDTVVIRAGGSMKFITPWGIKGWPKHEVYHEKRPLRWNLRHWIEVEARPEIKEPLELLAKNLGNNKIEITTNKVRKLKVLLHPKMVDFDKPVVITLNGKEAFNGIVKKDPELLLNLVREFDDRGRIFWAQVDLETDVDHEGPLRMFEVAE